MSIALERRILEGTYDGCMTVTAKEKSKTGGETVFQDQSLYRGVPCALSVAGTPENSRVEDGGLIRYKATVFCAPELVIPPGCRIEVTRYGRVTAYRYSGEHALYPTHQQIEVQREERP